VLKRRLVQAVLLVVAATTAVSASAIVEAAEECRAKPGPRAPSGSRWLYRSNRTDHRHCWFVSSKAVSAHSQLSRKYRHVAGEPEAVRQDQQGGHRLAKLMLLTRPSRRRLRKLPRLPLSHRRKILLRTAFRPFLTGCHHPVRKRSRGQQPLLHAL
jgi:hypothetical protein